MDSLWTREKNTDTHSAQRSNSKFFVVSSFITHTEIRSHSNQMVSEHADLDQFKMQFELTDEGEGKNNVKEVYQEFQD